MEEPNIERRSVILAIAVLAILVLFSILVGDSRPDDIVINEPFNLSAEDTFTVDDGARVIVNSTASIDGLVECDGGPLYLVLTEETVINGTLRCNRDAELPDDDPANGVILVLQDDTTFGPDARIESNGNVQIVDDEREIADTQQEVEERFEEAGNMPESGVHVGPFIDPNQGPVAYYSENNTGGPTSLTSLSHFFTKTKTVHAQNGPELIISGEIDVPMPGPKEKQIVLLSFSGFSQVTLQDFTLSGPDGRPGRDDTDQDTCDAKGGDGHDALRFNASAPNLAVNNFTLNLGDGGYGGGAETKTDCESAVAEGGDGGESGNFIMTAARSFEIQGAFTVNPGVGGEGGYAIAHGKQGDPNQSGGTAESTGGDGADNRKELSIAGSVAGTQNILIGGLVGGKGGYAVSNGGAGGPAIQCGTSGGPGGQATATGGAGGDAVLTAAGGASRVAGALDIAGDGGEATANGGEGADGAGACEGGGGGNGGDGGDSIAEGGVGGVGRDLNGEEGIVFKPGGDAGDGGDGCPGGDGGIGGDGDPEGFDGEDGRTHCPGDGANTVGENEEVEEESQAPFPESDVEEDADSSPPGADDTNADAEEQAQADSEADADADADAESPPADEEDSADEGEPIEVIYYDGAYIEIAGQLYVQQKYSSYGGGCVNDSWHSEGTVYSVNEKPIENPDPNGCGFGLVEDTPVMEYYSE